MPRGSLEVAGSRLQDIVLWTDTSPKEIVIGLNGEEFSLWNCWQDERSGITQAWVGNAGMIIEERHADDTLRFRCNSRPTVTFEDLIFELEFVATD